MTTTPVSRVKVLVLGMQPKEHRQIESQVPATLKLRFIETVSELSRGTAPQADFVVVTKFGRHVTSQHLRRQYGNCVRFVDGPASAVVAALQSLVAQEERRHVHS